MSLKLLNTYLSSVTPESKYFLIVLLRSCGVDQVIDGRVQLLSERLGVSDRVVTKSMRELVGLGYFNRVVRVRARGRPSAVYTCTPELRCLLRNTIDRGCVLHESLILDLCTDTAKPRRHALKVTNRLLLAVLLSQADVCGVVRGVSIAQLSKLTGMSKDGLRSQLLKLKALGYISYSISGGLGLAFFGRAKGAYFLYLHHHSYRVCESPCFTMLLAEFPARFKSLEAFVVFEFAKIIPSLKAWEEGIKGAKQISRGDARDLECVSTLPINYEWIFEEYDIFCASDSPWSRYYLQLKIEEYASILLSTSWNRLSGDVVDNAVMRRVEEDITVNSSLYTIESRAELVLLVYKLAFRLACSISSRLKGGPGGKNTSWVDMTFLIEPTTPGDRSPISTPVVFYKRSKA